MDSTFVPNGDFTVFTEDFWLSLFYAGYYISFSLIFVLLVNQVLFISMVRTLRDETFGLIPRSFGLEFMVKQTVSLKESCTVTTKYLLKLYKLLFVSIFAIALFEPTFENLVRFLVATSMFGAAVQLSSSHFKKAVVIEERLKQEPGGIRT